MKNLIVFCFAALFSQAAFAQQTATTPAPVAEKKSCCAAGAAKAGASCSASTPASATEKKSCCAAGMVKAGASCTGGSTATATNVAPPAAATARTTGMVKKAAVMNNQLQTAQFQVWGNCGMCKKTIEKAANGVTGVEKAEWNVDTHQFTVVLDPAKTSLEKVHQSIAAAGYDTDLVTGNDEAYNSLHGCCQYERRK